MLEQQKNTIDMMYVKCDECHNDGVIDTKAVKFNYE